MTTMIVLFVLSVISVALFVHHVRHTPGCLDTLYPTDVNGRNGIEGLISSPVFRSIESLSVFDEKTGEGFGFQVSARTLRRVTFQIYGVNGDYNSKVIEKRGKQRGHFFANVEELLSFAISYPKVCRRYKRIVALDSVTFFGGVSYVLCVVPEAFGLRITKVPYDNKWDGDTAFLVVSSKWRV